MNRRKKLATTFYILKGFVYHHVSNFIALFSSIRLRMIFSITFTSLSIWSNVAVSKKMNTSSKGACAISVTEIISFVRFSRVYTFVRGGGRSAGQIGLTKAYDGFVNVYLGLLLLVQTARSLQSFLCSFCTTPLKD